MKAIPEAHYGASKPDAALRDSSPGSNEHTEQDTQQSIRFNGGFWKVSLANLDIQIIRKMIYLCRESLELFLAPLEWKLQEDISESNERPRIKPLGPSPSHQAWLSDRH